MRTLCPATLLFVLATGSASAASTVRLPPSACPSGESIFRDGFETVVIPADPSNGSGGAFPGNVTRTVAVPQVGTRTYYLHLPTGYTPTRAWPLLFIFHG